MWQDGGVTRVWTGKLGLIAASTGDIDRHHSVINSLGDRYLYFRMPKTDVEAKMLRAMSRDGNKNGIQATIKELLEKIDRKSVPVLDEDTEKSLRSIAIFVAQSRTAVVRDNFTREVEFVNDPEEPVRLYLTLRTLSRGLMLIGLEPTEVLGLVARIALDSLPPIRLWAIKVVSSSPNPVTLADVMEGSDFSETMVRRALEDLTIYRIIAREGKNGVQALYSKNKWLKDFATIGTFPDILSISLENKKEEE